MLWKIDLQGTIGKQTALHVVYMVPHPCDVHMLQVGLVAVCELFFGGSFIGAKDTSYNLGP